MERTGGKYFQGLTLLVFLALAGCGESNPFAAVPIRGKITGPNGEPLKADTIVVHFVPQNVQAIDGKHAKPGNATLSPEGAFSEVTTFEKGDGAVAGRHKVVLEAYNADSSGNYSAFPAQYSDPKLTPLEIEVKSAGENQFTLVVEGS